MEQKQLVRNSFRSFSINLADYFNQKIWLKVIFQSFPIVWSTIVLQCFKSVFYDSSTGNLHWWAGLIAGLSTLLSIIVLVLTGIKSKRDYEKRKELDKDINIYANENALRKTMSVAEAELEKQCNRLFRHWLERKDEGEKRAKNIILDGFAVKERLNLVMDALRECLHDISGITSDHVYISAAWCIYNPNSTKKAYEQKWEWISNPPAAGTMSLDQLLNNPKTMFRKVVDGMPFIYENDKATAAEKGKYVLDKLDEVNNKKGSIICLEIAEDIEKLKIRMIISISTYVRIVESDDEDVIKKSYEDRIKTVVIDQFAGEIREDLLLLVTQELMKGEKFIRKDLKSLKPIEAN